MQTKDSLQTYTIMEKSEAEACLDLAVSLVRENLKTFTRCFPDSNSRNQLLISFWAIPPEFIRTPHKMKKGTAIN